MKRKSSSFFLERKSEPFKKSENILRLLKCYYFNDECCDQIPEADLHIEDFITADLKNLETRMQKLVDDHILSRDKKKKKNNYGRKISYKAYFGIISRMTVCSTELATLR